MIWIATEYFLHRWFSVAYGEILSYQKSLLQVWKKRYLDLLALYPGQHNSTLERSQHVRYYQSVRFTNLLVDWV
jgi:hypothetical protein